jgi:glycosyltransferase involved in cell wall biosynthesis
MILFLTYRMKKGFGVDLVVANIVRHLRKLNISSVVGCIDLDSHYDDLEIIRVPPSVAIVKMIAKKMGVTTIIAHTSPFFEILPDLAQHFKVYAWEHGNPTPQLTSNPRESKILKENKLKNVYPRVHGVVAISRFVAKDIKWPRATVVYSGCEHMPALLSKTRKEVYAKRTMKVGALMRLGKEETEYKGNHLLIDFFEKIRKKQIDVEFHLMGRGTSEFAQRFIDRGFKVHLNASDTERNSYLREMDIFFSPSLWEGFNLPLVEAQAVGTMGLALNIAAHPEVTPFAVKDIPAAVALVASCLRDPNKLLRNSRLSYNFVRKKFSWETTAIFIRDNCISSVASSQQPQNLGVFLKILCLILAAIFVIRQYGLLLIMRQAVRRYLFRR